MNANDYTDARELHPQYRQTRCPNEGTIEWFKHIDRERLEWFKHIDRERWVTDQWNCQSCSRYLEDTLEYPCPECDIRMVLEDGGFRCRNVDCGYKNTAVNIEGLRSRLSSDAYPEFAHKPGVLMGECPVCGDASSVNGGPDGELECEECGEFYAGQYMDSWYCYAIWMRDKEKIRVTL